ncbi:MAG: hypothetical protein HY782_24165 [Chloroflexi bacterium]|nr:hypothetical protein [Chloroflexota bacterium]
MRLHLALMTMLVLLLAACAAPPTPTPLPTATAVPPPATPVPPTATRVPPTATSVPPTATRVPPTATPVPPTATRVPPTPTATPRPKGWVTIKTAHSPSPRTAFAMRMLPDGRVLLFGGKDKDGKKLNDTWVFGPAAKAQRQSPGINLSLALSAGLGGAFAPWLAPQSRDTLQAAPEDWTQLIPINSPSPRDYVRTTTLPEGKMVLFGGELQDGTMSSDLYKFDPKLNNWEPITKTINLPPARGNANLFAEGGSLYVQGGFAKLPNGSAYVLNDFWRLDFNTSTWTELPKAPGFISANAYPVSNPTPAGTLVNFVDPHAYQFYPGINYYYDTAKNTWGQAKSKGDVPGGAWSHYAVAGVGARAMVTGGLLYDPNTKQETPLAGVWVVDMTTWEWTRLGDLPFPLSGHGGVFDGKNNRYIVWAQTGSDLYAAVYLMAIYQDDVADQELERRRIRGGP